MISGSGSTNQLYCNTEKCHIIYICPKDGLLNCSVRGSQQTGIVHNTLDGYENVAPDVSEELKLKCKKYTSRENFDFYIDKHALLALVKNV